MEENKKRKSSLTITAIVSLLITGTILFFIAMVARQDTSNNGYGFTTNRESWPCEHCAERDQLSFWEEPPIIGLTVPPILDLTQEDFLYDFDFLIKTLEENFPSFGIIYRRNGVDMLALAAELRLLLLDEATEWDYLSFYELLRRDFLSNAWPVGHLRMVHYQDFMEIFYHHHTTSNRSRSVYSHLSNRLRGSIWYTESAEYMRLITNEQGFVNTNIVADVIANGNAAYIRLPDMRRYEIGYPTQASLIDSFFAELEEMEHLIIDLRGHTGGWTEHFKEMLVTPFIDHPLEATFHHFYMAGRENTQYILNLQSRDRHGTFTTREPFSDRLLNNLFGYGVLSQEIITDLRQMDMYMPRTHTAHPNPNRRAPFDPKIWLLTDMNNFSAAQHIAAFFHQTGFATLVGNTTGGMAVYMDSFPSHFFTLPNTGFMVRYDPLYIISADGRPWEYGTAPHHFNRDGMNALQTVLALIAEGNY
ncbi:MAG: S41 family peptidase [Defluviitaleaceae bacterium]|nr:S41 family peptidase [Defluviitaleaceae bacterium]